MRITSQLRGLHSRRVLLLRLAMALSFVICLWRNAANALALDDVRQRHPTVMVLPREADQLYWVVVFFLFGFIGRECIVPCADLPLPQLEILYTLTSLGLVLQTVCFEAASADCMVVAFGAMSALWLSMFAAYVLVLENVEPPHVFATLSIHKDVGYPCRRVSDYLWMRVPFTLYASWLGATTIASLTVALATVGVPLDMYIYISCFSALLMANVVALLWQGDLVFASVGAWAFVWLEMKSAGEKTLVVANSDEFAAISAIQAMATLGLCVLVSLAVILLLVRFYVRRTTQARSQFNAPYYGSTSSTPC